MLCFLNDGSLNMPGSELSWSLLTVLTEPITWCLRLRLVLYMFSLIVRLEYGNHTMKYHEIPHKIKMPCFTNDRPWNAIMKYRNIPHASLRKCQCRVTHASECEIWKAHFVEPFARSRDPHVIHIGDMSKKHGEKPHFFSEVFPNNDFCWSQNRIKVLKPQKLWKISQLPSQEPPRSTFLWLQNLVLLKHPGFLCFFKTLPGCIGRHICFLKGS